MLVAVLINREKGETHGTYNIGYIIEHDWVCFQKKHSDSSVEDVWGCSGAGEGVKRMRPISRLWKLHNGESLN